MSSFTNDSYFYCCQNETQVAVNNSSGSSDFNQSSFITSDQWIKRSEQINVAFLVAELIVATFAILGNALVIIVFFKERKLRRKTNYYIISLAFADFFVGTIGIPFALMLVR
jgi:hypothetical protein